MLTSYYLNSLLAELISGLLDVVPPWNKSLSRVLFQVSQTTSIDITY
jgi:hypothetical protein